MKKIIFLVLCANGLAAMSLDHFDVVQVRQLRPQQVVVAAMIVNIVGNAQVQPVQVKNNQHQKNYRIVRRPKNSMKANCDKRRNGNIQQPQRRGRK